MGIGIPKGGSNRKWDKEDKLRIVKRYLNEGIGRIALAKEENISGGMLYIWIQKYLDEGEQGLVNNKKKDNHYAAIHTSKTLSEVDRLRLIVAKQEVEIERLKKGYLVKGAGANKEFVITKDVSLK
ncbi:transposase-like protein [Clostridium saccharoperbutylacetonicum]|jgi:transposase-like protein|uniref:Transposase n=1 Tax=Clostridium saccharoperbutylacetonicum N1-4(HMT) TaxID=931276 RepID=M1MRM6_9CLOT|nr:transposase [Clostridium saccharoperbutylacetonicum]AGF54232.1 transposase [Clostridium saccharoperbutylacetonicum N1-4(HMT)]NRT59254.1 transposase-like protein [Clostridium saccharoperbutylacetonicum]NSB28444.1 transposase-like protein [Clostridium saccharoperbutylacetonicum]NSB41932.1 transposase-like protein [Clostridium saccharoperbutylacetonicum]